VRSAALEALPYADRVPELHTEAELDAFLRLHPAGSSRPRVVVILDDVRRRMMSVYTAAGKLARTHHFAQVGAARWVVQRFKVQRVPCFIVIDPATRQGATQQPQLMQDGSGGFAAKVGAHRFLPELDSRSFEERCGGEWSAQCAWAALLLVPSGALGQEEAARRALRRFREACRLVRQHSGQGMECFWLRHDGASGGAAWHEALRPLLAEHAPSFEEASGVWVAAVAGETLKAAVFTKTVVGRELAQRDLAQWLQRLLAAGQDPGRSKELAAGGLEALPPLPRHVEELTGPRGFVGRLTDTLAKAVRRVVESMQEASTEIVQVLIFGAMIGWPIISNLLGGGSSAPGAPAHGGRGEAKAAGFSNGQSVVVDGLRQHTEYNGLRGRVLGSVATDAGQPPKYRVALEVDGQDRILAIRGEHLRPA